MFLVLSRSRPQRTSLSALELRTIIHWSTKMSSPQAWYKRLEQIGLDIRCLATRASNKSHRSCPLKYPQNLFDYSPHPGLCQSSDVGGNTSAAEDLPEQLDAGNVLWNRTRGIVIASFYHKHSYNHHNWIIIIMMIHIPAVFWDHHTVV